ncbi:MAG: NAD-dependent epimerase/dehydratase family protein [Flavobacteriaceae bacterium]
MKVLITGGLGQIGSHISEMLLDRGDKVIVIDNLETGRMEHLSFHKNLTIHFNSIADRDKLFSIVQTSKPDIIIHTAASYKSPNDWYNDTLTNCVGGGNVIEAAKAFNVNRFIYFQTALCYGQKHQEQPVTLNHPRIPSGSSYAITKTTNELFLELSGIDYVTFRLANVIGPRNVAGPLPIFYQRLKDGKKCYVIDSRRDFIFVKDLAKVVLKACDGIGRGAYNFSSGSDVSILELYDAVVKVMEIEEYPVPDILPLGEDDVFSILLDSSKTISDYGDIEFTPLQETVFEAIKYYKVFGTLGEYTHLNYDTKK